MAVGIALALVASARGDAEAVLAALEPVAALSPNPAVDEPGFWPWQDLYAEALVGAGRAEDADAFLRPHEALAARRGRAVGDREARPRARAHRGGARPARAGDGRVRARARAHRAARHALRPGADRVRARPVPAPQRPPPRRRGRSSPARATRFADLGRRPALERCERELEACGLKPAKRGRNAPPELTPQEQAVARLVATGRTNREVAAELLLSVKTVEVHLTRIYAKLGVSSRSQLAANPYKGGAKE